MHGCIWSGLMCHADIHLLGGLHRSCAENFFSEETCLKAGRKEERIPAEKRP